MTKKKAFTLIELLIVIAIIGILFIVLVSKVDFATDKAKATGVQTDFRSFQLAFDTVAKENAGFNTFGWDTGDANQNGKRDSYDEGDANKDGIRDTGEVWTGHKVYDETFTKVFSLKKNGTGSYDRDALNRLEAAINANLDPKLHITIKDDGEIVMANGAQDPWNKEYHGWYITNAEVDKKDRGAIVMYSDGANNTFGSEHKIENGVVTITVPGSNKAGKDDYSIVSCYTYVNGYGEVLNMTTGFSNNQGFLGTNNNKPSVVPDDNNGNAGNNGGNQNGNNGGNQDISTPTLTLNEYGFYFNQPYQATIDGALYEYVFYPDGSASLWGTYEDEHQGMYMPAGEVIYTENTITIGGDPATISDNGKTLTASGLVMILNPTTNQKLKYNVLYENASEGAGIMFSSDGSVSIYEGDTLLVTLPAGSAVLHDYYVDVTMDGETTLCPAYPNGSKMIIGELVLSISLPVLDRPIISFNNGLLNIEPVNNANHYQIFLDDTLIMETDQLQINLASYISPNNYYISVSAVANLDKYKPSPLASVWVSNEIEPGIYDTNDQLLISWAQLINEHRLNISQDYSSRNYSTAETSLYYILSHNNLLDKANKLIIDPTVSYLGEYAIAGCEFLTSIIIPKSVANIGSCAFYGCYEVTELHFEEGIQLTTIKSSTFSGLSNLQSLVLPEGLISIESYGMSGLDLQNITIPSTLKSIGFHGQDWCDYKGVNVYITDLAAWCNIDFQMYNGYAGNYCANPLSNKGSLYLNGELVSHLIVPEGTTAIKTLAFIGCTSIEKVTIPGSVTTIGSCAFQDCINLTDVDMQEGVRTIEYAAFSNTSIINLWLPNSIELIENGVFSGCKQLVSINIPDNLKELESTLFYGCNSLTTIIISSNSKLTTISNSQYSSSSGDTGSVFYGCTSLTEITLPVTLQYIGTYAFNGCSALININYLGTIEQWNAIEKASSYNATIASQLIVNCTNGSI